MFSDACNFAKSYPECAVTTKSGRKIKPPLHPIPVQRPLQILGIDYYGSTPDREGETTCSGDTRSFYQMALCVCSSRSESLEDCKATGIGGHSMLWCSRGSTVR